MTRARELSKLGNPNVIAVDSSNIPFNFKPSCSSLSWEGMLREPEIKLSVLEESETLTSLLSLYKDNNES